MCSRSRVESLRKRKQCELMENYCEEYNRLIYLKSDEIQKSYENDEKQKPKKMKKYCETYEKYSEIQVQESRDNISCTLNKSNKNNFSEEAEIQELKEWVVGNNIPHVHVDKLLKILKKNKFPSLPSCAETLLKKKIVVNIKPMEVKGGSMGEYTYLGIKKELKFLDLSKHTGTLELVFNIDGFSPFKSSQLQVWPILAKVYSPQDLYPVFTVAVFAGNGKPDSLKDYLKDFILELKNICSKGIKLNNIFYSVKIKFFSCDTPTRAYLKAVKGHTCFDGCERCRVKGEKKDGVTVFLDVNAELKTDTDFINYVDSDCHNEVSPLAVIKDLPVGMVSQFIIDPMHTFHLGAVHRSLDYLLSPSTHSIRLSASKKLELIRRTENLKQDVPDEFPRKMCSTSKFAKYKATELKFFGLYASIIKKLVSPEVYDDFMLLVVASRVLSSQYNLNNVEKSREYLKLFVEKACEPKLYGHTFASIVIHNLVHLCDDIQNTQCNMQEISAFNFESYLGTISHSLRSPLNVVSQYCRRVHEKNEISKSKTVIIKKDEYEVIQEKKGKIFKLKYENIVLFTSHPNSTVLVKGGIIGVIQEFVKKENKLFVSIYQYTKKESVFRYPCESSKLNIFKVNKLSQNFYLIPLDFIEKK